MKVQRSWCQITQCWRLFRLPSRLLRVPSAHRRQSESIPRTGRMGWLTRPYRARTVPPINLANTSRLDSLIRAGQSLSLRAGRGGAGARKQYRYRSAALWPAARARSSAPRRRRRPVAERGSGRGCRTRQREPQRRQRQHERRACRFFERREFERADPAGSEHAFLRPHHHRLRQFPAPHHSAEQHGSDRNHRARGIDPHLSGFLLAELSLGHERAADLRQHVAEGQQQLLQPRTLTPTASSISRSRSRCCTASAQR